jgi:hypothetical protein
MISQITSIAKQLPLLLAVLGLVLAASGQTKKRRKPPVSDRKPAHVGVNITAARSADVTTIDGLIHAYYDVVSGPAGQPRQWARDRTLYMPDAHFVALGKGFKGEPVVRIMDHQEYVDYANPKVVEKGFFEREIHRVTHRFGNIVNVISTYESRNTENGPVIARGVNSLQLFWGGTRWWIASAIWDEERPENPIPKELLP